MRSKIGFKSLFLILIVLIFSFSFVLLSAYSEELEYLSDKMDCLELSDKFMKEILQEKFTEGFELIEPYFPISAREFQNLIDQTEVQLRGSAPNFGTMIDYEFVREETVNEFLVRYVFVIKHQYTLTRWLFVYYRPDDQWLLNSLNWDDQVSLLFANE